MAGSFTAMFLALPAPISSRGDAQGRRMAEDENGEVPKLPPDARLESLDERLDRMQQAEATRIAGRQPDRTRQFGQRMAAQMIENIYRMFVARLKETLAS